MSMGNIYIVNIIFPDAWGEDKIHSSVASKTLRSNTYIKLAKEAKTYIICILSAIMITFNRRNPDMYRTLF